jgi:Flp pilus assembly protein TadG
MMLFNRERRGQSLVEFALILPIFVLVLVGVFDLGRAVFAFNTISQAAREGARLAIVDQTISHIQDEASKTSVSLGVDPTDVTIEFRDREALDTPNSCAGAIAGDDNNHPSIVRCMVIVTVPYDYDAATPILGDILGTLQMEARSQFKVDFNCEGPECPLGES